MCHILYSGTSETKKTTDEPLVIAKRLARDKLR